MARLFPTLPLRHAINAGEYAELDLLQTLERGLSDAYTLFHSVDWSRGTGTQEQHGEVDIVVVNQGGYVLLMEVKAGSVDFQPRQSTQNAASILLLIRQLRTRREYPSITATR